MPVLLLSAGHGVGTTWHLSCLNSIGCPSQRESPTQSCCWHTRLCMFCLQPTWQTCFSPMFHGASWALLDMRNCSSLSLGTVMVIALSCVRLQDYGTNSPGHTQAANSRYFQGSAKNSSFWVALWTLVTVILFNNICSLHVLSGLSIPHVFYIASSHAPQLA